MSEYKKDEIDEKLEDYYKNKPIPQLDEQTKEKLRDKIRQNQANARPRKNMFKKLSILATCLILILIPCIVLPIALKPEKYYKDNNVTQTELTTEYVTSYINENFEQYNFIFSECEVTYTYGIYSTDTNELLSINIELFKLAPPFSTIKIDLVVNKNLELSKYESYFADSEVITNDNYTMYKKTIETLLDTKIWACLEFNNYELYLEIDRLDEDFFNMFVS